MKLLASKRPRLNLALQGGGAHGAFTAGVVEHLLRSDVDLACVTGTSAGAVNTALIASAWNDGRDATATRLAAFWTALGETATPRIPGAQLALDTVLRPVLGGLTQIFAPAELNPLGLDPLRDLLEEHVDFNALQANRSLAPIIAATEVATALPRLFRRHEITVDAVRASACLPSIHAAVMIDGRAYWDGGYTANPPIQVLLTEPEACADTLIVQINPTRVDEVPSTANAISGAMSRLTFQQPLLRDVQFILDMRNAMPSWPFGAARYAKAASRHRFHLIDATSLTAGLDPGSKLKPTPELISGLRKAGGEAADAWLEQAGPHVGRRETVDLATYYFSP